MPAIGKHPHGRGEDPDLFEEVSTLSETPPRAWGRRGTVAPHGWVARNTPTGVGKTVWEITDPRLIKKHPHGRGEDAREELLKVYQQETPPRAWGRHLHIETVTKITRNTPTGVGKT